MDNIILGSEGKAVVTQMKKLGSRLGKNRLGRGDHKREGSVAGASTRVLGSDSELAWPGCRDKERPEQEEAGPWWCRPDCSA